MVINIQIHKNCKVNADGIYFEQNAQFSARRHVDP